MEEKYTEQKPIRRTGMKRRMRKRVLMFGLTLLAILWIAPLAATVWNSLRDSLGNFSLAQYHFILIETPVYLRQFWNSVILVVPILAGCIAVSLLGAYGFSVLSFRGKDALFFLYLVVMLLPLQVTLMPNYMVAAVLGIKDSYWGIIMPAIFQPFGVFLLRQQMRQVPIECMEAARMDGADSFQMFLHIYLPLVKSGIAALAMLLAIEYWNLIDQALIFIKKASAYPLSVYLARINTSVESVASASAVFYSVPILVSLFYGQRALKEGIGLMGGMDR